MQSVIDACNSGYLNAVAAVVITNNANCKALDRARTENIPNFIINNNHNPYTELNPDSSMLKVLQLHNVDWVVLAGYMKKVGTNVLSAYAGRIINIHPSLLPKYGGKGMYGRHVHEAVLAAKETETGVTVHIVEEEYDKGPILAQRKVPVDENDTAESLARKVLAVEHLLLPDTLFKLVSGEIEPV